MNTVEREAWIEQHKPAIADFCRRWQITEFALFGSVLRDDFGPDSDIDVLVTFAPEARWTLFDMARMETELEAVVGRKIDLVEREGVEESPSKLIRRSILNTAEVIYVP